MNECSHDVVLEICTRWQKTRILFELYQHPILFAEFEKFRHHFPTADTAEKTFSIVDPGFEGIIPTTQYLQDSTASYGNDFKSKFHRTLCLHSLAITTRKLAKATASTTVPKDDIVQIACNAWAKEEVPGLYSNLSTKTLTETLETWDFIYHFLLRKTFPPNVLTDWIMACADDDVMLQDHEGKLVEDINGRWPYLMNLFRWTLHPQDVALAIAAEPWKPTSSFAPDKPKFLADKGAYDDGAIDDMDWYTFHERQISVDTLGMGDTRSAAQEERSQWDRYRMTSGSPFNLNFDWSELERFRSQFQS